MFRILVSTAEINMQLVPKSDAQVIGDISENHQQGCLQLFALCGTTWLLVVQVLVQIPAIIFLGFLVHKARRTWKQIRYMHNPTVTTYYLAIWVTCLINLVRASMDMSRHCHPGSFLAWDLMWMTTKAGMLFLEVFVLLSVAQGQQVHDDRKFVKKLILAFAASLATVLYRAVFLWFGDMKMYGTSYTDYQHQSTSSKFLFWGGETTMLLIVYTTIMFLPYTKWRDKLPARSTFIWYVRILAMLNWTSLLGTILLSAGRVQGYCVFGFCTWVYCTFYPPGVYITFISGLLQDEEVLELESEYYSEMRDAGYFEDEDF
mmetsp:Transcript_26055/g.49209  ORF Transcript_26055/g.49209 Transcript_26055/m.49209 type:complete len:317 (-) Transcript_26055:268-1218(-)